MKQLRLFIASTGQDVGKTTLCLGIIDYLIKKLGSCGYIKPVGQIQLVHQGLSLDKDAVLIKNYFLLNELKSLSPISIPQGFTKDFLDQKINHSDLLKQLKDAEISLSHYPALIIEGTGHMGVGSIVNLSNADVAKLLHVPVILVTKGGLGSSFDELVLNISLAKQHGVPIAGVVLNKVIPEKKEEIARYFKKALQPLDIPFLGALPFDLLLSQPTFADIENKLQKPLMANTPMRLNHVQDMLIIASNHQIPDLKANDLVIVSASREGLISGILNYAKNHKIPLGLILTGSTPPSRWVLDQLKKQNHFVLYTQVSSQNVLIQLSEFHAKIGLEDKEKIAEAIDLIHRYLDLSLLDKVLRVN